MRKTQDTRVKRTSLPWQSGIKEKNKIACSTASYAQCT